VGCEEARIPVEGVEEDEAEAGEEDAEGVVNRERSSAARPKALDAERSDP
jgi:hypothetical protein